MFDLLESRQNNGRLEDVPPLAGYYLRLYSRQQRKSLRSLTPSTLRHLQDYPWPGNVLELQSIIENIVARASPRVRSVTPEMLPEILAVGA